MDKDVLQSKMKVILATSFSFYLKAHNYHWNVTGPNFAQYHKFLGDLYEEVWNSLDTTAEEIRKLDSFAPGSLSRYSELSHIEDELNVPTSDVMFKRLREDNSKLLTLLYGARKTAEEIDAAGTLDYLESRIGAHEKHRWMLNSFLS
jgi:starvation-inducible DNA-binding protein